MAERIETGTRKFTQLRNTLHDGRAYCCFVWDYLGELARDYNGCRSVPEDALASGLYRCRILRVSTMESYPYTSCRLQYVTLSCTPRIRLALLPKMVPTGQMCL